MPQQTGANSVIIFDTETTYKTTPAAPDATILPFTPPAGLKYDRELVESKTIATGRLPKKPGRGKVNVLGDIPFELAPQYGKLLKHIFGAYTVAGGAAPYTHTYKVGALPAGMTIEEQFPTLAKYLLYNGCKVSSFKAGVTPSGIINASISLTGAKASVASSSFDSSPTDPGHTPFDGFSASIKQGGSTLGNCTKFDFELSNDLDAEQYVIDGTGERASLPEGMALVKGSVQTMFDSTTLYELALAHTETSLELHMAFGAGTGASAGNEKLSFYFDEVVFKPKSPEISGTKGLLVDLEFIAYYNDAAAASNIRAVLLSPTATF